MSQRHLISISMAEDQSLQDVSRLFKFNELYTQIIKALKPEKATANLWSALVMTQSED